MHRGGHSVIQNTKITVGDEWKPLIEVTSNSLIDKGKTSLDSLKTFTELL